MNYWTNMCKFKIDKITYSKLQPRTSMSLVKTSLSCILKYSVFGNFIVRPAVSQSGISSGRSNHWLKHLNIALHVPLNFSHQKFLTPLIRGADEFFCILIVWCNFFSLIVNFCTIATFCPIFFATVFMYFRYGVLVLLYQIPTQNSSNIFILGTLHFSWFVETFPWNMLLLRILTPLIFMPFIFMLRYLNLSSAFSFIELFLSILLLVCPFF